MPWAMLALATLLASAVPNDRGGHARAWAGTFAAAQPTVGEPEYRLVGCDGHGGVAYRSGPPRREVAIGFDDGPAPDTEAFVTMLERSHARATFFMIGEQITDGYRRTLLRELKDGDALGDHTFTHPNLTRVRNVHAQLADTAARILALSGYEPCVFRPPYGDYDPAVVADARGLGLATVVWDVDPSDYARPGTNAIVERVLSAVRPGAIIVSHDGGGNRQQTLAAYPRIIAALHRRGYRVVTIPQLLGFRPEYRRCVRLCDGLAVGRLALPRGALIEHGVRPSAIPRGAERARDAQVLTISRSKHTRP
jgi:peptidoglycan/xylan/chitin deacetylase (PgdA/CDA1 family)